MSPLVVAVDPGPSYTGIVVRADDELLGYSVPTRSVGQELSSYAEYVVESVSALVDTYGLRDDVDVYAVESYDPPNPHVGAVHPTQIAETAWLTGFVYEALRDLARDQFVDCVLVPPNKHGRSVLGAYPTALTTEGERRGNWRMRAAGRNTLESHARSAWDVVASARIQLRIAEVDG